MLLLYQCLDISAQSLYVGRRLHLKIKWELMMKDLVENVKGLKLHPGNNWSPLMQFKQVNSEFRNVSGSRLCE